MDRACVSSRPAHGQPAPVHTPYVTLPEADALARDVLIGLVHWVVGVRQADMRESPSLALAAQTT